MDRYESVNQMLVDSFPERLASGQRLQSAFLSKTPWYREIAPRGGGREKGRREPCWETPLRVSHNVQQDSLWTGPLCDWVKDKKLRFSWKSLSAKGRADEGPQRCQPPQREGHGDIPKVIVSKQILSLLSPFKGTIYFQLFCSIFADLYKISTQSIQQTKPQRMYHQTRVVGAYPCWNLTISRRN